MEHQTYALVDIVALTLAAALTAAIVLIGYDLIHELAELPQPWATRVRDAQRRALARARRVLRTRRFATS
jgi:hypothetical protein